AYKLTKTCFLNLLNTDLKLNRLIINAYAERITNTSKKASFQKLYTSENGLQRILKLQETENIEISKADLSAYLGISVRSLNRSLKKLKEEE
ncbi:MAG TPA: Crp/Fnr family transcriptional regulator, partial [Leeuwenhoekiella sp.]|nr:Crp/Fnr family transcriptional regulator [Leeuwenhoekiella sp.]